MADPRAHHDSLRARHDGAPHPGDDEDPFRSNAQLKVDRLNRRRSKIAAEIQRNRAGGHRVPTWVLGAAVVAVVLAFAALLTFV